MMAEGSVSDKVTCPPVYGSSIFHVFRWAVRRCFHTLRCLIGPVLFVALVILVFTIALLLASQKHEAQLENVVRVDTQLREGSSVTVLSKNGNGTKKEKQTIKTGNADHSLNRSLSLFAEKYAHHYSENDTLFLQYMERFVTKRVSPNTTELQYFRDNLGAALGREGNLNNFVLTTKNTKPSEKMAFYMFGHPQRISSTLRKYFPNDVIYRAHQYPSCSIVGSSGILKGSRCGKEIDNAAFVIRFNTAPVHGFERDVGSKTNFTTLNPSFIRSKLNCLKTKNDHKSLENILKQFRGSHFWQPAFAVRDNVDIIRRATEISKNSKLVEPILGHPSHFLSVSTVWRRTWNITDKWPTTGLYMISSFIDICDRLDVFGFWPFSTALNGSAVPYHYADNINGTKIHNFGREFRSLVHLYERGIIQMHLGTCS